ncbi:cutinase family protein [Candidatus Saccharibacteria bacterium]|nr:cutinase family protein [Candidatus Saccharibacteria bacterium]
MRGKILIQNQGGRNSKTKVRYLVVAAGLMLAGMTTRQTAQAAGCPDVRVVFARGSGGERWEDQNYLAYKKAIEEKLKTTTIDYEFVDLDYPAIGIGDPSVLLGAYFGAGEAYEFGESVKSGVKNLDKLVNDNSCPNTKYVLGGYSQGAMVVSGALSSLRDDRLIYAATFGDPKLYLPEGQGIMPAACKGENLSDYRVYVPDCQAYKGMLGAYMPYEPEALEGKVGTWCNKRDIMCSSKHWDLAAGISDHVAYIADDLYEDASRVIFDKICMAFGVENTVSSPHDTAILIDSTGSMASMIDSYKAEALRLAEETLASGGRVALYDYRDLGDPYEPVKHCGFDSCTLETFEAELAKIRADGGGDTPESLLSGSFHVMQDLNWKQGSTKSLVVLTDANFLSPDRDGMSFDEVVALSKRIDPVNFYIITNTKYGDTYEELATATDGRVVTNFDELSLLTDYIMERYDSLPRVEEEPSVELPVLVVDEIMNQNNKSTVRFHTSGTQTVVALNDGILGVTNDTEITITGLRNDVVNTLTLVPLDEGVRGEPVIIKLDSDKQTGRGEFVMESVPMNNVKVIIPKTPNTGRR